MHVNRPISESRQIGKRILGLAGTSQGMSCRGVQRCVNRIGGLQIKAQFRGKHMRPRLTDQLHTWPAVHHETNTHLKHTR